MLTALATHKGYEMFLDLSIFGEPPSDDRDRRLALDEREGDRVMAVEKRFTWLWEGSDCLANLVCSGLDKGDGLLWAEYGVALWKEGGGKKLDGGLGLY